MGEKLIKFWPFLTITFVIFAFFFKLFWPLSIFITPDYGRSDSWHLSIANKYYLQEELKKNRIPIWNPSIGTGFPTLAEGQTGIFFLPNIVLFRLFPFVFAYNLDLALTFLIASLGTYLFARSLNLSKLPSTYAALVFALSGFLVVHVQHLHLAQTASLMPLLFWAVNEFSKKKQFFYLLILSLVISQQLFAGFPQLVFYGLVALLIYSISISFSIFKRASVQIKFLILIASAVILGFLISAVQVLPTAELLKLSSRQGNPRQVLSQFPYKGANLLQFLNPFILGSPKDATYPRWVPGKWGIFWENTAYVGILPLALALTVIVRSLLKRTKKFYISYSLSLITLVSVLFALGELSPLHPVFSFPPFSIFRVPSRFLLVTQFGLVVLSAICLQKITNKKIANRKIIAAIILALSVINLFWLFFSYNPVGKAQDWFANPKTASFLKETAHQRIYSTGHPIPWNKHFLSGGWHDTSYYFFARNSLDQNSNLIYAIDQFGAYESLPTQREDVTDTIILNGIGMGEGQQTVPKNTARLLASLNVSHIITPYEIKSAFFEKKFETKDDNDNKFKVFENTIKPQRVLITNKYQIAQTVPEITQKITQFSFDPFSQTVLEEDPHLDSKDPLVSSSAIVQETSTQVEINASSSAEALLVLADSYYPGWQAYVNNQPTPIFAANINTRAVKIPSGQSTVIFKYQPKSLQLGLLISVLSTVLLCFLFLKWRTKTISGI